MVGFELFSLRAGRLAVLSATVAACVVTAAQAQTTAALPSAGAAQSQPGKLGEFGDWGAYVSQTGPSKVCYVLSQPKERLPAGLNRDPGFMFISHRPADKVRNEVSTLVGFPLKEDVDVEFAVGTTVYKLYPKSDGAWFRSTAEEEAVVSAMRAGREVIVKSKSRRGNETTDRYSLAGLAKALDRIAQECK